MQELDGVREVGHNEKLNRFVAVIVILTVVVTPQGVPMLTSFVRFQQSEARLIKVHHM